MTKINVGIIGASGFTGAELLRISSQHPHFDVRLATGDSMAGRRAADLYPSLELGYPNLVFEQFDPASLDGLDLVILGLPHAASMDLVPQIIGKVGCVVDLSAAFRLQDTTKYPEFYGFEHTQPEMLGDAVYGLPEFHRIALQGAQLIATPGCHVTAAALALKPLVDNGLIATAGIAVNSLTGITGAGRSTSEVNMFTSIDSNTRAYGLLTHRHTPEIEQEIGAQVLFTPHHVPMSRGILATCTAPATAAVSGDTVMDAMHDFYADEPFVAVINGPPQTKSVMGSNAAHVSAQYDERTGIVLAMCAIDNLTKGASGGAVQAANVALGLDERAGLSIVGGAP